MNKSVLSGYFSIAMAATADAVDCEGSLKSDILTLQIGNDQYGEMFMISTMMSAPMMDAS